MPRLETMTLSELLAKRHPKNPKEHDLDELARSFERFGFVAFPTLDETSDVLVAGHGRCEALAKMKADGLPPPRGVDVAPETGDWFVPTIRGVSFANELERDAYIIADNAHVANGGWNLDRLGEMVSALSHATGGLDGIGLGTAELESMLGSFKLPTDELPPEDDKDDEDDKAVQNDVQVTTTITCPSCKHSWQEEKGKKKRGRGKAKS